MAENVLETKWKTYGVPHLERAFGVSVTIKQGANETSAITARRAYSEDVIGMNVAIPQRIQNNKYIIQADDIPASTYSWMPDGPKQGMAIVEGSEEYRIVPPANGPAVELLPGGFEYLCNTELVK